MCWSFKGRYPASYHLKLCSKHFSPECYDMYGNLKFDAIPTLFTAAGEVDIFVDSILNEAVEAIVDPVIESTFQFSVNEAIKLESESEEKITEKPLSYDDEFTDDKTDEDTDSTSENESQFKFNIKIKSITGEVGSLILTPEVIYPENLSYMAKVKFDGQVEFIMTSLINKVL